MIARERPAHRPARPYAPSGVGSEEVGGEVPFILGLGSNVGDRRRNLETGLRVLGGGVRIEGVSRLVESEPWGPVPQDDFLNLVVRARARLDPFEVLSLAQAAEAAAGRVRTERYGPRTLDVDLIFFGDLEVRAPQLSVPHPQWRDRPFVFALLADVAAGMKDPESGRPLVDVASGPLPETLREVEPLDVDLPRGSRERC